MYEHKENIAVSVKNLMEAKLRLDNAVSEINIAKAEIQASSNEAFKYSISFIDDYIDGLNSAINHLSQHIDD